MEHLGEYAVGSISVTTDASQAVQGTRNYYPFSYIRVRSGDVKTNDACNQIDSRNQWGYNFDDWCINAGGQGERALFPRLPARLSI